MSSILENPAVRRAALPITVRQYHQLGDAGIISKNTELVRGVILEKMIKSPKHSWLVQRMVDWFRPRLPNGFHVRQEQPLTLSDSEPEPDIAVVRGCVDDYQSAHPTTAQLVVEIAVTSADLDREKASVYAAAGVAEYVLVLVDECRIELRSHPSASAYTQCQQFVEHDHLVLSCLPGSVLELHQLFHA